MTAMTDVARLAATEAYMAAEVRLRARARRADATRRPATADDYRRLAAVAHRAALAEEQNPEPRP